MSDTPPTYATQSRRDAEEVRKGAAHLGVELPDYLDIDRHPVAQCLLAALLRITTSERENTALRADLAKALRLHLAQVEALRAEYAEVQASRDRTMELNCKQAEALNAMREELNALRADKARLDWLESAIGRQWQSVFHNATITRPTIDAAMKATP